MKILVAGAGALGGYFGGRLLEKGEDVTFLVRENRKKQLSEHGLTIHSPMGNYSGIPKLMMAGEKTESYDLILMATKAYHLEKAIEDVRPFAGEDTLILPVLNGMLHMDQLTEAFGEEQVLGGLCFIEATLDENGGVVHSSPMNELVYGERSGGKSKRMAQVEAAFSGTKADFRLSETIEQEMWHKHLFITVMSGITSLMRSPIGPIREEPNGRQIIVNLLNEAASSMRSMDAPIADNIEEMLLNKIDGMGYEMKSSMQRDIEKGLFIEADHLQGHLVQQARQEKLAVPVLETVYASLKVYEKRR